MKLQKLCGMLVTTIYCACTGHVLLAQNSGAGPAQHAAEAVQEHKRETMEGEMFKLLADLGKLKFAYGSGATTLKEMRGEGYEVKEFSWPEDMKYGVIGKGDIFYLFLELKDQKEALERIRQIAPAEFFEDVALNGKYLLIGYTPHRDWEVLAHVIWGAQHPKLYRALVNGDLNAVKKMKAQGVDLKAYRFSGDLYARVYDGEGYQEDSRLAFLYDMTALHVAVQHGHIDLVKYLIQQGFDVKADYGLGYTFNEWYLISGTGALSLAIARKNKEMFHFLLKQGLDINRRNQVGFTPALGTIYDGGMEWITLAEKAGGNFKLSDYDRENALFQTYDYEVMKYLAGTYELDPLVINRHGESLLFYQDDPKLVEYLLKAGVKVKQQNFLGENALHWAYEPEVIRMLIRHGADLGLKNYKGQRPIDIAIEQWDEEGYQIMAEAMKKKGMKVPAFPEED